MPEDTRLLSKVDLQRLLPKLLDLIEQPVIVIEQSGKVIYINQAVRGVFGWPDLNGKDHQISELFTDPDVVKFLSNHIEQLMAGEVYETEFTVHHNNQADSREKIFISTLSKDQNHLFSLVFKKPERFDNPQLGVANQILTRVDKLLGDVVDYDAMFAKVAQFVVPQLADLCAIHMMQDDKSLERMALAIESSQNNKRIFDWIEDYLPNDESEGLPAVIKSAEPKLVAEVNPVLHAAKAGINSYMILPLITHRRIKGVITFVSINPQRRFSERSLEMAENIAINLSIYLEKNRLYKESLKLKEELEQRVNERTAELTDAIAQLKQSEAMIQTLFRVSNKLNATLEVDQILDELAQEAIRIVDGESGFAGLRTENGMTVHKYFHNGVAIPFEHTWSLGEGIPGWVLKYKVPYGTSDAENDPLIRHELSINDGVHSVICTPILDSVGEVIGYFDIRNKLDGNGFTINDQEMLLTIAPVASIAIQNALAYQRRAETLRELKESSRQLEELAAKLESAREEERMSISRELHDQLGQSLTAMKFDMTSLSSQLNNSDNDLAHKAKDILTQINTMIKTVRKLATELRPGMLDDLGLVPSIEWQASDFQKRTGIECKVNMPGNDLELSREQSLAIYRILQESLTNIARYADASHVNITGIKTEDTLNIDIRDDGRGIRPEEIRGSRSLGLLGMRERVRHIGGSFAINGTPNQGTTIYVSIPIKKDIK